MVDEFRKDASRRPEHPKNVLFGHNRSLKDRTSSLFHNHAQTLISSLGRLIRSPYSSTMTISVIAVALTLPSGFYLLAKNFFQLNDALETNQYISVFLKPELTNEIGGRIEKELSAKAWIKSTELVTKEQGMREFRTFSGFDDALAALDFNPLPVVIKIEPAESARTPAQLTFEVSQLERISEVDSAQIDLKWLARLNAIVEFLKRATFLLGLLLGSAVIFIVGNTIRLELQNRHDEIIVAKLVGATASFIRRPFLYSAFWYGLLGSLLGLIFGKLFMTILEGPIDELVFQYSSNFFITGFSFQDCFTLVVISVALAVIGAWLVLARYLRELRAE